MKVMKMVKMISLMMAVLLFCAACTMPGSPEHLAQETSQINGVDLSEFAIVYSEEDHDYSKRAAEYIQSEILARTGLELALIEEDERTAEYEIVVGETSRDISARLEADTRYTQFAILAEDRQVALEGDYFIIAAAAYFFIETYVPRDDFSAEIPKEVCIHEPIVEEADNFILLIGDGMGLYQTLLFDVLENTDVYSDGEDLFYGYYLPYMGLARTTSLSGTTDSAAAGTALACGIKTINSYLGQTKLHTPVKSITELAGWLGKSTAIMSTDVCTGATPAAFTSHAAARTKNDTILRCQAKLQSEYGTIIDCDLNQYVGADIAVIEEKIENALAAVSENENGFFFMYEEGYIDKYCHNNDITNTYTMVRRFNQAIARFMEYAFYHPNTFVLITADHETGKLLPNGSGGYSYNHGDHSSHYVPVFAYGDGAELFDDIVVENIQIPQTIATFMGVVNFGDQSTYKPLS